MSEKITEEQLKDILLAHKNWLSDDGGERANLRYANLCGADLRDADLSYADLRDADLRGADLRGADLSGADLIDANLSNADLRHANLVGADLRDANLCNANLRGANLRGADLRDANLRGANLRNTDLRNANLSGADLRVADLSATDAFLLTPWGFAHIRNDTIRIGCEYHTVEEWSKFSDDEIADMDPGESLDWWRKNKTVVLMIANQCEKWKEKSCE